MTRLPDWEPRLQAYLRSVRGMAHAYGSHDCALHASSVVDALTGADPAAAVRGHYTTARGSMRVLRRHFGGSLEAALDARFERIAPGFAQRGDLVLHEGSIGVCIGADALFVGEDAGAPGLVRVPRRDWTQAWRL
jgi:hypothetical protein